MLEEGEWNLVLFMEYWKSGGCCKYSVGGIMRKRVVHRSTCTNYHLHYQFSGFGRGRSFVTNIIIAIVLVRQLLAFFKDFFNVSTFFFSLFWISLLCFICCWKVGGHIFLLCLSLLCFVHITIRSQLTVADWSTLTSRLQLLMLMVMMMVMIVLRVVVIVIVVDDYCC